MFKKIIEKSIVILAFLVIWETASQLEWVNPMFIPPFSKVVTTIWELFSKGQLISHISISLYRALSGFFAAIIIAVPLGFLLGGWFRKIEIVLEPVLDLFSQFNPFVLFHIILLFLGLSEATKITIITWTCIWPIMFSTIGGMKSIHPIIFKAGRCFGLNRLNIFLKIILPATAPSIFTGIRLSLGYSMFMLIAAEMMGCESGLGWLILNSQENYQIHKVFAVSVVIAIIGVLLDSVMQWIERRVIRAENIEVLNAEA